MKCNPPLISRRKALTLLSGAGASALPRLAFTRPLALLGERVAIPLKLESQATGLADIVTHTNSAGDHTGSFVRPQSTLATAEAIKLAGKACEMWVTLVGPHTLRVSLLPVSSAGQVQQVEEDIILVPRRWPAAAAILRSRKESRKISWGESELVLSGDPPQVSIGSGGSILQQLEFRPEDASVRFLMSQEPVWGLGEGGRQFDRRGAAYPMRHGERVPDLRTDGARLPIPWVIGAGGWALFFHTPFGTFDLTGRKGVFQPRTGQPALPLDVFAVVAERPDQILREYAGLTGFPHMPPVWALGYQQSHRTLSGREEVMSEAETFRRKKLPCDVLIYLGTGFCPSGWNTGHGSYEFNPHVFPDPKQMIEKLHEEDFRIVLHEDKPPRHLHGRVTDTGAAAENPEDAAFYWKEHLKVFELGIDGWWADEGDWLDDTACLVRNRTYWEGAQQARPNVRPYTLNRNGYAGIQRYGWVWSGDIDCTWDTLRDQVAVGLNLGLSGMPYWGTDTGGFRTTPELTGELYARWFQFSAFCPLFRSHGRTWKLRLPWGWDTGSYGPIEVPQSALPPPGELHNAKVEPVCQKYLNMRYRLLPYLYTLVREAHETGLPIMRALWLHYPEDPRARTRSDEYLWGPDMLVAPVFEKGAQARKLYLPQGAWYDFWTEEKIEGGREIMRVVDLATLPLYVRAGSILPMGPVRQCTTETDREPVELVVYPGAGGRMGLYEDDGLTFNFRKGEFTRTRAIWEDKSRRMTLTVEGAARPREKQFRLRVVPESSPRLVTCKREKTVVKL